MSTVTENQDSQAGMPAELAHRAGDGIDVLLLWDRGEGRLKVVVDDLRSGGSFELVASDGRHALDASTPVRLCSGPRPRRSKDRARSEATRKASGADHAPGISGRRRSQLVRHHTPPGGHGPCSHHGLLLSKGET